jgi:hypothetical protein
MNKLFKALIPALLATAAAMCSKVAIAQTTTPVLPTANLTFSCTTPAARELLAGETTSVALPASEIDGYNLYEVSATGVRGAKVANWKGTTCGGTITGVSGTKRYVVFTVDTRGVEGTIPSNTVLVTTSGPKSPVLQVRVDFKVTSS